MLDELNLDQQERSRNKFEKIGALRINTGMLLVEDLEFVDQS